MKKDLLLILSGNLSTTPRALKVLLFLHENYNCKVVLINRSNLWGQKDQELIIAHGLEVVSLALGRRRLGRWIHATVTQSVVRLLYPFFKKNKRINAYASNKASVFLNQFLNSDNKDYDLVLGFSAGSLYPAYRMSQKKKIPFIFDVEDYHPGELIGKNVENEKKRRVFLLKQILPSANHITFASPLIMEECFELFENPEQIKAKSTIINNCFSEQEFTYKDNTTEKIKFVWFSQNIAEGRGLEEVLPILAKFSAQIELHLIGNLYDDFRTEWISKYKHLITVHEPQSQKKLNNMLSQFDVGLALEIESEDYNRQICLTNKIWAYLQSGLYILATDTPAQKEFIAAHPASGVISSLEPKTLQSVVENILKSKIDIRQQKRARFEYARQFSWEKEQQKLKKILGN